MRANEGEEGLNFTPYLTVDTVRGEVDLGGYMRIGLSRVFFIRRVEHCNKDC